MSTTPDTVTEAKVLCQLVTDGQPRLSEEAARAILGLRPSPSAISRMHELGEKAQQGTLSEREQHELDTYLRVGNLLNILQAQALLSLPARERAAY